MIIKGGIFTQDEKIIDLFWNRSENAISETARKYGRYCYAIAYHILGNGEDAEESVNDTYLSAWNAIPPQRPAVLAAFLGRITRQLAIDRYRTRNREKRGGGEVDLALEELDEIALNSRTPETAMAERELVSCLNRFLKTLSPTERNVFLWRYWHLDSIADIAARTGFSTSKVTSMLFRIRGRLKKQLIKEDLL